MDDGIFAGGKFYISLQVPSCTKWKNLVREHGGEVTTRENDAHHLIFDDDHPERAPFGAISYKIIRDSLDEGVFQEARHYRIEGIRPRPVGSTQPAKVMRAPFLPDEDRMIYEMVQKYESGALPAGKAQMWKDMERQNPRHTWQSYQDRYNKTLKFRPPEPTTAAAPPASQASHKRKQSEDEQQNESNTKKKRVSADPEHNVIDLGHVHDSSGSNSQDSGSGEGSQKQQLDTHEQVEDSRAADEQLLRESQGNSDYGAQLPETLTDEHAFSMPEPPDGFLETQMQETQDSQSARGPSWDLIDEDDVEAAEEANEETQDQEAPKSFPELVKTYRDEGYDNVQILAAARSTCGNPHLMEVVLGELKAGKDIPDDVPGVWTSQNDEVLANAEKDDECFEFYARNKKMFELLESKHGTELIEVRKEFLSTMKAEGVR